MVVVQVLFQVGQIDDPTALAERSAGRFRGLPGLLSKHYLHEPASGLFGGMYVWESREAAEAFYTPEWRAAIARAYGSEPMVRIFDVPLVIDNTRVTVG